NVRHVRQITKAMYAIAATQVIQRKRALWAARPFGEESAKALARLWTAAVQQGLEHPLFTSPDLPTKALLVVNADRGLCGRYVGDINRAALRFCQQHGEVRLLLGGEKAYRFFRARPWIISATYLRLYERPSLEHAERILADVLRLYRQQVGEVWVVYMHFRGELVQRLKLEKLLPLEVPVGSTEELILEPALPQLLTHVAQLHLLGRIFTILLSAKASEQAIRRQTMKAATDNADELLEKLTLLYNKARQHAITAELADIMGGAEALREGR
ncbi:MAG TPA: F0F1 ATP synthase subunit gamma, partial [Candidatus Acetothermia bacterium]|nr:F0F1 ATP synthase subunit gamma [Candidatus Acetothermia bacterium]